MSTFQAVVLGVCAALVLIGVGVFASFGGFGGKSVGPVTIWGTVDTAIMEDLLSAMRGKNSAFDDVVYREQNPATYATDLVNAMAAGTGPDLFLMSNEQIHTFSDKILEIPYGLISQSSFLNSYIDESQIFLTQNGEIALPFMVDPLVMYWNRDMLATAGVANPPQYWNDLLTLAPRITSLDGGSTVKKSAVAIGEWRNVANAKAILSTLMLQAGERFTTRSQQGTLTSVFGTVPAGATSNPAESALRFYTEFSNPSKTTYSWNRSLPRSTDMFVAGDAAIYFGFASELPALAARNPNLRFGVAVVPQIEGLSTRATYGRLLGLAIPRTSQNPQGAATVAELLAGKDAVALLAAATGLPPVRRDVSFDTSASAAAEVFTQSALIARGWLDPDQTKTDTLFATMIESVISGKSTPASATAAVALEFNQLLPRF